MKYILFGLFSLLTGLVQAQTQENNQLWKQVYQHYMEQDLNLHIEVKSKQESNNTTMLLDSSSIFFVRKGSNTLYKSKEQDILTTSDYYIWVNNSDSIVVLREKKNTELPSTIAQLEKLDSALQTNQLDFRKEDNYAVFSITVKKNKTEIYVNQIDKTIHKILYTYQSNTLKTYTEVSYTNNLLSSTSSDVSFDIENYVKNKRKGWKLNELYKNYTLVIE
ncbi:hypothetical protein ACE193_25385 (plasmid) [Bernardetia sp. OM2101]|uniref:hypothetical protein n=1 Tax=Bernardetia sp. OM2101 TaxID=3344876 RepID=UPI0035CED6B8